MVVLLGNYGTFKKWGLVAGLQVTGGVLLRVIVGIQKPSLLFGFIDPNVRGFALYMFVP